MNTEGIVLLSFAILFFILPFILYSIKKIGEVFFLETVTIFLFIIFAVVNYPHPYDKDVRDGKAIYIVEKHIAVGEKGDTIYNYNTYRLEWLPEWKYGRKH